MNNIVTITGFRVCGQLEIACVYMVKARREPNDAWWPVEVLDCEIVIESPNGFGVEYAPKNVSSMHQSAWLLQLNADLSECSLTCERFQRACEDELARGM